jgi:hypothetical protein
MEAMLPTMFPSFDDRIQEIREVKETIFPIWETLDKGEEFPLEEILDITIPNLYSNQPESLYSPQQLRFQRWFESDKGQETKDQLLGTPAPVRLAGVSIAAIAYSTGSMGIGATSPEIQRYDESAFAPGVGGFSII